MRIAIFSIALMLMVSPATAQVCTTGNEIDAATKAAIENTARQVLQQTGQGDVSGMQQLAIPAVAGGLERAISEQRELFSGAQGTIRGTYLLEVEGNAPMANAVFYCGLFNGPAAERLGFSIPNLAPGRYAIVIQDTRGSAGNGMLTVVLQQMGGAWKLAGYYPKSADIAGHNGDWYLTKAREYKANGQKHNAWFYYEIARSLKAPVNFMGSSALEKLYEEQQSVRPPDVPVEQPVSMMVNGKEFRLSQMFTVPVKKDLYLVVRYQVPSVADTAQTHLQNLELIKGVVAQYPEFRDAFTGVVARATEASGQDFGSQMLMKEIK